MGALNRRAALLFFALTIIGAPLAYGAGDRIVQVGLLALLAAGMWCVPPAFPELGRWEKRVLLAIMVIAIAKELLPAALFGQTRWRSTLVESFGVPLPWTHHPEPSRFFDALLSVLVGAVWFSWARTLADDGKTRLAMAWILFGAALLVALACFMMPGRGTGLMYGVRAMPGWSGFGPFPNRNHTACFLAMGALVGCGCCVRAARHRKAALFFVALAGLAAVFLALIESRSRGGLIACVLGLIIYAGFALARSRDRKTVGAVAAAALVGAALFLSFGSNLWSRFDPSRPEGDIPTNLRWGVWRDAVGLWWDAPLFGHGPGTFAQIFPIYQQVELVNQLVLHPESSWLKWLDESGALLLLLGAGMGGLFYFREVAGAFRGSRGLMLRAGGFAAFAVLMLHSLWDVPAHRWATAGFGLAALAFACPLGSRDPRRSASRWFALAPAGLAAFWILPIVTKGPAWSPERLNRALQASETSPNRVTFADLEALSRWFPLDANLHQEMGMRLVRLRPDEAWRHFRIVDRLRPSSWTLPAAQAFASRRVSAGMTLHFWTLAIERAGHRRAEVFGMANRYTAEMPIAEAFWARYAETNPSLLLIYAASQTDAEGRLHYQHWWDMRGASGSLEPHEVELFYRCLPRWGTMEQFWHWTKQHADREAQDYRAWAGVLHTWGDDAAAWEILARHVADPPFPAPLSTKPEFLEAGWLRDPKNVVNAQALASAWHQMGELERCQRVILAVAAQEAPPPWFLRKAAYIYAARGDFEKAVAALLKER
jgi:hypothetical protein